MWIFEVRVWIFGDTVDQRDKFGERLRKKVAETNLDDLVEGLTITISIGVAKRQSNESFNSLLERADQALYRAKNEGRNRVVVVEDN